MLDYQNLDCPVCHKRFNAQDDIVVCPHCGAPHHRDCWKRQGHCVFEKKHGTADQWRPPASKADDDALICGNCGYTNSPDAVVCVKCGRTLEEEFPPAPNEQQPPVDAGVFYSQFSPYIGIAPDSTMDGQPVMDIATFVGPNAAYYMSRFHFMRMQKSKMSWNWAAALFPVEWLLYRKMYRPFWVVLAISFLLSLPYLAITFLTMRALAADPALIQTILSAYTLPESICPYALIVAANVCSFFSFALRAVMAFLSNHLYRRHVMRSIDRIREEYPEDMLYYRFALSKKGGTSLLGVIVFFAAIFLAAVAAAVILAVVLLPA